MTKLKILVIALAVIIIILVGILLFYSPTKGFTL
jgi:hypothetical protein